ncbi:hypothetical protein PanWU01x14_142760 [Parasponia andersonii]|uniref:Uncharacterized protein n=1 Tax=Parasponia andersonii TaxID=3476 RepID=A0A2P5CLD1_PARAD|nr:hypothetical protein PanWU01x14_142760 [Parasponia andersonii]
MMNLSRSQHVHLTGAEQQFSPVYLRDTESVTAYDSIDSPTLCSAPLLLERHTHSLILRPQVPPSALT